MKKLIFTVLAFCSFSLITHAQDKKREEEKKSHGGGFRLGVKGGVNANMLDGVSFYDQIEYSYHLGGFAEIDFNKKIGIQPEVIWSQSRTIVTSSASTIYQYLLSPNQNIQLNYLTIPLLLRYNIGSVLSLVAGPQFGILMNSNQNLLTNGGQAFSNGDFAMDAGLQLNLKTLRLYGRYVAGMKNINDINSSDKWTNRQIQVGLGIKL